MYLIFINANKIKSVVKLLCILIVSLITLNFFKCIYGFGNRPWTVALANQKLQHEAFRQLFGQNHDFAYFHYKMKRYINRK